MLSRATHRIGQRSHLSLHTFVGVAALLPDVALPIITSTGSLDVLLNALHVVCSVVSAATGITTVNQDSIAENINHKPVTIRDTPGLADVATEDKAAKEIEQGLSQPGIFKINFVMTVEAGRIRPRDLRTIDTVQ